MTLLRSTYAIVVTTAGVVAVAWAAWAGRPASPGAPSSLAAASPDDVARQLRRSDLETVPASDSGDPRAGFYVCQGKKDSAFLRRLVRHKVRAGDWRGVVFVQREFHPDDALLRQMDQWGDKGLYAPPYLVFGDPELVTRVRVELQGDAGGLGPPP